jgi:hypothetical protein
MSLACPQSSHSGPNSTLLCHRKNLVEKIVRTKIYECTYWKAHCFAVNAETIIDRAVELRCLGGTYGGTRKPTDFICLVLKMLQIQPEKEIITEFILNEDYKYLRLLGASSSSCTSCGRVVQSVSACRCLLPQADWEGPRGLPLP